MVMPGDNISLEIELHTPVWTLTVRIREGGRNRRRGNITEILKWTRRPGTRASRRDITEWVGARAASAQERKSKMVGQRIRIR